MSDETTELRYQITLYPSPVLRRAARPVEAFDEELEGIVAAMMARMYASKGVGLAAPQVGLRRRIMVLNATGGPEGERVLVNPTITDRFGGLTTMEEGCLSFPEIYAEVERPESCTVKAFAPSGEEFEETFDDFASRVVQHEYDHLEGVLLVDRMSPADKQKYKSALADLVARYRSAQG
jgi:peptide deformylase